ncbi:ATP-binding cassette domain-containing protein [Stakelama sp. CBK3Z-3]|uniref:ATP-binding cassette domain-containing protein n=1 Tax=Stakelama flava TaxID=2860338 RepID=A0ABS6XN40_9SPHN|nr:ATP-binding cassette domain-containing protein [Stakelama flava]MBW4331566.1 ATP-binding cassette domain-containing protein [Stakelama flava]
MNRKNTAGFAWLLDLGGAALFALGIAMAVTGAAQGGLIEAETIALILTGGLIRAIAVGLVHRLAIAGAQRIAAARRLPVIRRLIGEPLTQPPSLGQSAVFAIDHPLAIEQYQARFMPSRFAASAAPLLVIALVAFASLVAAGILFATFIPFIIGMIFAGTAARRASEQQLNAMGQLSGLFVDRVRALSIIRHFHAEERITRQVRGAASDLAERTVSVLRVAFLSSAVLEFFSALAVALVAVYCGFSLLGMLPFPDPETLTLREAFFALAMAPEFYLPMRRLAAAYHEKQLGEAAEAALDALPAPLPAPENACAYAGLTARAARIEWPGRSIGPVSFTLGMNGLVALTGPTGSGKTSLLAGIAGQVALTDGAITPIPSHDIAWAAQRPLILPGSLRDNLTLGRDNADDAEIVDAAERVGLGPLIAARGEGLDLMLDHRGSGLSGGERRRLGLARAILARRPLLLADEPTADLDAESARDIAMLLLLLSHERALVVATHDPLVIETAQQAVAL